MSNKSKKAEVEKCSVCKDQQSKYHCPADRAPYCSVICFKQHKATDCSASSADSKPQFATNKADIAANQSDSSTQKEMAQAAPLRSLETLMWPPDPLEEGLNALLDPLNRDEPKPLLHSELLAVATSVPLRELLSTHPFLKDLLQDIARIPNAPPKYPQARRIRDILGLGEADGVPSTFTYRPKEDADNARDALGKRPFQTGGGRIGEEERKALHRFNELVKSILQEERSRNVSTK